MNLAELAGWLILVVFVLMVITGPVNRVDR